jgi:hypothetical protein
MHCSLDAVSDAFNKTFSPPPHLFNIYLLPAMHRSLNRTCILPTPTASFQHLPAPCTAAWMRCLMRSMKPFHPHRIFLTFTYSMHCSLDTVSDAFNEAFPPHRIFLTFTCSLHCSLDAVSDALNEAFSPPPHLFDIYLLHALQLGCGV